MKGRLGFRVRWIVAIVLAGVGLAIVLAWLRQGAEPPLASSQEYEVEAEQVAVVADLVEDAGSGVPEHGTLREQAEFDPSLKHLEEDTDLLPDKVALAILEIMDEVHSNLGLTPNIHEAQFDYRMRREETRRAFARRGMNPERLLWGQFPYQNVVLWFDKDGRLRNCSIWQ